MTALQQFRTQLYHTLPKRSDAIFNLLDALCSSGHQCRSVIELSESPAFERQYSSITDAIADGLTYLDDETLLKCMFKYARMSAQSEPICTALDATPQPRPFARKLADKTITHAPNPAPGNKPICVGHSYSLLALLPQDDKIAEKHWAVPLSIKRINSTEKGNTVGMKQLSESISTLKLNDELVINVADSLYGSNTCRQIASENENLVHIFRLNSKRNIYFPPKPAQDDNQAPGRKQEYGQKINLKDITDDTSCDEEIEQRWSGKKGRSGTVFIRTWHNMQLRGTREFRSAFHPLTVLQIIIKDGDGNAIFKNPMWLAAIGKRRSELSTQQIYQRYSARYDVEHFFRFGKNKLLMDKYQTCFVKHEEAWWKLVSIAYLQLFLAKHNVTVTPKAWERYLPEYKTNKPVDVATPTQTQRQFKTLLDKIGSPAKPPVKRGNPRGRILGDKQPMIPYHPVIFKTNSQIKKQPKANISTSEKLANNTNPETINELLTFIQSSLRKLDISTSELTKLIENSS